MTKNEDGTDKGAAGPDGSIPARDTRALPGAAGPHGSIPARDTRALPGAAGPDGSIPARDTRALPSRKRPAHGVFVSRSEPTIVFLTVCTLNRQPWLNHPSVHTALVNVWKTFDAWWVGFYLLMPDHLHLFCSPYDDRFTLDQWVSHWKRKFSCLHIPEAGKWQRGYWDTRLRRSESYDEKWMYIQLNPVRKKLAETPEQWPFQGIMNELRW